VASVRQRSALLDCGSLGRAVGWLISVCHHAPSGGGLSRRSSHTWTAARLDHGTKPVPSMHAVSDRCVSVSSFLPFHVVPMGTVSWGRRRLYDR